MGILQPITPPAALTLQEQQALLAVQMTYGVNALYKSMVTNTTALFNKIWNHPTLTPADAFLALGTNAVSVHQLFLQVESFLNAIQAGSLTLAETSTVTEHEDGTITLS